MNQSAARGNGRDLNENTDVGMPCIFGSEPWQVKLLSGIFYLLDHFPVVKEEIKKLGLEPGS